jgi:DNA replication licensing factor MCM5
MSLTVDRELTDKVTPGNRVRVVGILSVLDPVGKSDSNASRQISSTVRMSYIRVLGLQSVDMKQAGAVGFAMPTITQEDEEKITTLARDPEVYEKISKSIASAIYGHADIKKAVACLLFGGSPKRLPDGMRLRGDINVLLLGDPSVAKS